MRFESPRESPHALYYFCFSVCYEADVWERGRKGKGEIPANTPPHTHTHTPSSSPLSQWGETVGHPGLWVIKSGLVCYLWGRPVLPINIPVQCFCSLRSGGYTPFLPLSLSHTHFKAHICIIKSAQLTLHTHSHMYILYVCLSTHILYILS